LNRLGIRHHIFCGSRSARHSLNRFDRGGDCFCVWLWPMKTARQALKKLFDIIDFPTARSGPLGALARFVPVGTDACGGIGQVVVFASRTIRMLLGHDNLIPVIVGEFPASGC
jgi:hypothetical protein